MNELCGLDRIQAKYPQAHAIPREHGGHLIIVPSVMLPKGWNKTIGTLLFLSPPGFPCCVPQDFWLDLPDLELEVPTKAPFYSESEIVPGTFWESRVPKHTNNSNPIVGFPAWDGAVKWFGWRLQAWSVNRDSLFTFLMSARQRLAIPR